MTPDEIISDVERRRRIRKKLKYLCIAFDGDHPQIVAAEKFLIPRSNIKGHYIVIVKWAGGCSMTQSPNDNNRGMHPVLKEIYADSKFRYDAIADPLGALWAEVKEYLKKFLENRVESNLLCTFDAAKCLQRFQYPQCISQHWHHRPRKVN
jgi:hypothetical protein